MKYQLRPYQEKAVSKLLWSKQLEGADICVLPTGAGKSIVIAELAYRLNQPILILQPSKEILEQNYEKLASYIDPIQIGIYSASMDRKDLGYYTLATIQSVYKKPELFTHFKMVLIDECHLVNPKNLYGMYTQFFKAMGSPKIIGMTATPYRMAQMYERLEDGSMLAHTTTKLINRLRERFWHRIVYNVNIQELIDQNYLVPLKYIDKKMIDHADIPTNITGSDFDLNKYEQIIKSRENEIIDAILFGKQTGKHVLVFCSSIEQASRLCDLVPDSAVVTAKTKKKERTRIISDFRSDILKVVFNVGVLTIGFDHPALDVIILLRPTQSIGLYNQMLGRGVRKFEDKQFCNVIDMTGTVERLGRIETFKIQRMDDGWQILSEKGSWHYTKLYSHRILPRVNYEANPFLSGGE